MVSSNENELWVMKEGKGQSVEEKALWYTY